MRTTSAKSVHKPLVVILIYTSTELKYELTYHACNRAHLHGKDTIKKSNIIFTSDVSGILASPNRVSPRNPVLNSGVKYSTLTEQLSTA